MFIHCAGPGFSNPIPFEDMGRFSGLVRPEYRKHLNEAKALQYLQSPFLKNVRFYHNVDYEIADEHQSLELPFSERNLSSLWNIRDGVPDAPCSYRSALVQRLFPSPDGQSLVPNQGSTNDPVKYFSPSAVGAIVQHIVLSDQHHEYDRDVFIATTSEVIFNAIECRRKRRKKKAIYDFSILLYHALQEQILAPSPLGPHFVQNLFFAFALQKAANSQKPSISGLSPFTEEMCSFFEAIPTLLVPHDEPITHSLGMGFTLEEYESTVQRLNQDEPDPVLSPREQLIVLTGIKTLNHNFPPQHYYSTTRYGDIPFSNCAEISLLNVFNLLLWDFETKSYRVAILQHMPFVDPRLKNYYETYKNPNDQFTYEAQCAWTCVVSGLSDRDNAIYYEKGEGTCEIGLGIKSMAGVIRALLPDNCMLSLTHNDDISNKEKIKTTLDHFLSLFSTSVDEDGEVWTWRLESGDLDTVFSDEECVVTLSKSGMNMPIINEKPYDGTIFEWRLSSEHFVGNFIGTTPPFFIRRYADALAQASSIRELSDLELWCISEYADLVFFLGNISGDPSNPMSLKIVKHMVMGRDYREVDCRLDMLRATAQLKLSSFYRMSANLLELADRTDPDTSRAILPLVIDSITSEYTPRPEHSSRFTRLMREAVETVREPRAAFYTISNSTPSFHVGMFLIRTILANPAMFCITEIEGLVVHLRKISIYGEDLASTLIKGFPDVVWTGDGDFAQ